ncbi:MAG: cupin domain-containing protein [Candidatus Berkelbacteria bacterium]|nr:cupin domain-containing protein [Candidatus Berkelbacteria bacterium]
MMKKIETFQLEDFPSVGETVKDTDQYRLTDEKMEYLTVSMTELHAGQRTNGHVHDDKDEIYQFLAGVGRMQLGEDDDPDKLVVHVKRGMIVLVPVNIRHTLFNDGEGDLVCWCVFSGGRNH